MPERVRLYHWRGNTLAVGIQSNDAAVRPNAEDRKPPDVNGEKPVPPNAFRKPSDAERRRLNKAIDASVKAALEM